MKNLLFLFILIAPLCFAQNESASVASDSLRTANLGDYYAGDHELLIMPTAHLLPNGKNYFTDYELFFLNFAHSFGSTHISFFTLFPITTNFLESFSLGVKQNIYSSTYFSDAAFASVTPRAKFYIIGNVFSVGKRNLSFHASISMIKNFENNEAFYPIALGINYNTSKTVSLVVEYLSSSEGISEDIENGLLVLGIKFRSRNFAVELGGVRILNLDSDDTDLLLIPLLKGTIIF